MARRRRPVEPIDIFSRDSEDLRELMHHYFPHVKPDVETGPPVSGPLETDGPDTGPPVSDAVPSVVFKRHQSVGSNSGASISGGQVRSAVSGPPEIGPPVAGGPISNVLYEKNGKPHRVYSAGYVQDGHTAVEQSLYDNLWRLPKALAQMDGSRLVTVSRPELARSARVSESNAIENLRSLVRKLAISIEGRAGQSGQILRLYSFRQIVERRQQAGMTYVVRVSRGVHFVNPSSGRYLDCETGGLDPGPPVSTWQPETGPPEAGPVGGPVSDETGPLDTGPHIRHIDSLGIRQEPSSSELSQFQEKAGQMIGLDDDAARTIIRGCRQHDPGASIDEIWHFCEQKILERARFKEPIGAGLLITAIPKYFALPASELNRYRAERGLRGL